MEKIGVEESLTNVQQALREKGYDVIEIRQESDAKGCSLCVLTGIDSNVMGIQNKIIEGPVIEANGLSAEEVVQQVESKLH
ncbi:YkuS family protein [Bacillus aquiflavi]|uniref:UPF0180 protein G4D64_02105 n=1 Tax=Bacillus aquiflavi TaxID=2672567 RepID=A0A6B3VVM7_9BACI|nr:YkuS family protein [Bacillus aquiflavi]MBA4535960.1 YkuS family protein [Bacillus aquiflavi]NEY80335.1 YkuS family protein [Bacillus aquiflavi]UAC49800.1 YkuS family protein [Bacillus aquiflavi]